MVLRTHSSYSHMPAIIWSYTNIQVIDKYQPSYGVTHTFKLFTNADHHMVLRNHLSYTQMPAIIWYYAIIQAIHTIASHHMVLRTHSSYSRKYQPSYSKSAPIREFYVKKTSSFWEGGGGHKFRRKAGGF